MICGGEYLHYDASFRIVVGAEAAVLPAVSPSQNNIVVGHTGRQATGPRAPAGRTGLVIGKLFVHCPTLTTIMTQVLVEVEQLPLPRLLQSARLQYELHQPGEALLLAAQEGGGRFLSGDGADRMYVHEHVHVQ